MKKNFTEIEEIIETRIAQLSEEYEAVPLDDNETGRVLVEKIFFRVLLEFLWQHPFGKEGM